MGRNGMASSAALVVAAVVTAAATTPLRAELPYCQAWGAPLDDAGLLAQFSATQANGSTQSAVAWSLESGALDSPGALAPAAFTRAGGTRVEGVVSIRNGRLCQSYDGEASWVCHGIAPCNDRPGAFAMIGQDGARSSVILRVFSSASAQPAPLCASPGETFDADLVRDWLTARTLTFRDASGMSETYVLGVDGSGLSFYSDHEAGIFWRIDESRLCVTYDGEVGEICRSFAPCFSGEGQAVTFLPDGSEMDLLTEVYDRDRQRVISPTDAVSAPEEPEPVQATSASVQSGNPDLDAYLAEVLPPHWRVTDIRFKAFPAETPGAGRLSVAGTLQLGAPLVSKWRAPEALRAAAIERGLAPGVFDGVLKRVFEERLEEYVIAQSPGNEVPFRAELTYLETVDGTDLGGRVDYDPGPGQPIDSVAGSYAYVVGDARFDRWVGEILAVGMPVQDAAGLALRSFFADYASGGLAMYRDGARILESGPITPLATPERLLNYGRVGSRIGEEGLFLRLSVPMRATAEMATRGPRNFAEAFVPGGPPSNVVASIAVPWGGAQLSDMAMAIFIPTGDGRESRYSDELYFDPASQLFSRIAFGGTLWAYGR